jgi:hypothetical protein
MECDLTDRNEPKLNLTWYIHCSRLAVSVKKEDKSAGRRMPDTYLYALTFFASFIERS